MRKIRIGLMRGGGYSILLKRFGILTFLAQAVLAQQVYTANKTTVLSGAAEVITVQQAASNIKTINFVSAFVDCSVACAITVERDGTAASSTTLATTAGNPSTTPASIATAWSASNVGTGTVITRASIPAGGGMTIDLSRIRIELAGTQRNLTVRTSSITGTVDIVITWTEASQ